MTIAPAPPHRSNPPPRYERDGVLGLARLLVNALQHRAAAALGVNESARTETVVTMLENNRRRAPGYWIQLTLAMGIAIVGLVLNSTAVVIGAMLVSPLMGPIVELGMGFAVGSSFLTLRAAIRVLLSVLVVVGGAALLTIALPFHEVTTEIAARTSPTALDLLVAVFCALTAAYTTVRPASDTTSAAAGTAIGIALVPPLCVAGFGLGTGSAAVAAGAALLFTANFSAILVLAVLTFLTLGFNQVDAGTIEQDYIGPDRTRTGKLAAIVEEWLRRAFGSRFGWAMRIVIPAVFLAAVYVPLRRALNEVTWEVRARDAIRHILASEAPRAVQTSVVVERHTVTLHLILIASNERAASLEKSIGASIAASTGVAPTINITAVPDAKTLSAATMNRIPDAQAANPDGIDLATTRQRLSSAIDAEWPAAAGPLAGWQLSVPSRAMPTIVVHHIGAALGQAAEALLASRWSTKVGARIAVRDAALERDTASAPLGKEHEWLGRMQPILEWVTDADRATACVSAPVDSTRRATAAQHAAVRRLQNASLSATGRLVVKDSAGWNIRVVVGRCQ